MVRDVSELLQGESALCLSGQALDFLCLEWDSLEIATSLNLCSSDVGLHTVSSF